MNKCLLVLLNAVLNKISILTHFLIFGFLFIASVMFSVETSLLTMMVNQTWDVELSNMDSSIYRLLSKRYCDLVSMFSND